MLFDLFDIPKEKEYRYWVERVSRVATTLGYDYFKLWELPELEFEILEKKAEEILENRKKQLDDLKDNK